MTILAIRTYEIACSCRSQDAMMYGRRSRGTPLSRSGLWTRRSVASNVINSRRWTFKANFRNQLRQTVLPKVEASDSLVRGGDELHPELQYAKPKTSSNKLWPLSRSNTCRMNDRNGSKPDPCVKPEQSCRTAEDSPARLVRLRPRAPIPRLHHQRHRQRCCALHDPLRDRRGRIRLRVQRFEQQFVMHLQQQPRL